MKTLTLAPGQTVQLKAPDAASEKGISPKQFGGLLRAIEEAWNNTDEEHAASIAEKVGTRGLNQAQLVELSQHLIIMGASGLSIKPEVEERLRDMLAVTPPPQASHATSDDAADTHDADANGGDADTHDADANGGDAEEAASKVAPKAPQEDISDVVVNDTTTDGWG